MTASDGLFVAGLMAILCACGVAFGVASTAMRRSQRLAVRCERLEAIALDHGRKIHELVARLEAIENGTHAEQMRQLVEDALVQARGWKVIAEESRAAHAAHIREHEGNGSGPIWGRVGEP